MSELISLSLNGIFLKSRCRIFFRFRPSEFAVLAKSRALNSVALSGCVLATFIYFLILFMHNNNGKITFRFHSAKAIECRLHERLVHSGAIKDADAAARAQHIFSIIRITRSHHRSNLNTAFSLGLKLPFELHMNFLKMKNFCLTLKYTLFCTRSARVGWRWK